MRQEALDKARDDPRSTPARILDAAEEVFAEQGFAGASTREIARRARVPFGALHYHWGSKRQLWQAVFKRLGERMRDTLLRNFVPGKTPGEILDNMTDAFVEMLVSNRNATRLAYRITLEKPDPYVEGLFNQLSDFGLEMFRAVAPAGAPDGPLTIFVLSGAFLTAVANETGQEMVLGDSVFRSRPARERLRAELRRLGRAMLQVSG
jgi:AcrR family transcriptional regulator